MRGSHMLTATPVTFWDIDDGEAFVRGIIRRYVRQIPQDDMEDMVSEGLSILCSLSARYDPVRDRDSKIQARSKSGVQHLCKPGGRCCIPSFAGYASFILQRKLKDVWYSKQPEWGVVTVNGKRTYVRYATTVSVEERNASTDSLFGYETDMGDVVDMDSTRHVGNFIPVPIIPKEEQQ